MAQQQYNRDSLTLSDSEQPVTEDLKEQSSSDDNSATHVNVIGVLWQMICVHRNKMALAILFGVLSSILQLSPAVFVSLIIDTLQNDDLNSAINYAVALIIASICCAGFFALSTMVSHLIAAEAQATVRNLIADKLTKVPLGYFQRHSRDAIKKLIIDDVGELEDGIAHLIPELTAALVAPLLIIIVMLFLHPLLALTAVLPTIAGFITFVVIIRGSGEINTRFYQSRAKITETLDEMITAIPEVKTYNRSDSALKRVHQSFAGFKEMVDDWIETMTVKNSWFYLFTSSNLLLVAPLGYYLYLQQSISLSLLVFFLLASLSFSTMTSAFFGLMSRLRGQEGVLNRYCALMAEPELTMATTTADDDVKDHSIHFEAVDFSYDLEHEVSQITQDSFSQKTPVIIDNLSLVIPQGSFTALVGPSGSGKSTLTYLLARFWDVQSGCLRIGGVDIRQLSTEKLSSLTSFVMQDVYIFTQSVRENICLGRPDARDDEVVAAAKSAQAHDFIMDLPHGYDTILYDGEGLSLGQKQRISIARALIRNTPILILDEATAYADPQSEAEVQKAISQLVQGRTVVVIAHRLSTITKADQIVYLEEGKIREQGKHDDLLALNGRYASQWQRHIKAKSFNVSEINHLP